MVSNNWIQSPLCTTFAQAFSIFKLLMLSNFSPSINLHRDADKTLYYLPTPNAQAALRRIAQGMDSGQRSFNIVGSYGTGKSAFLWALVRQLMGQERIFPDMPEALSGKFEVLTLVGRPVSLAAAIAEALGQSKSDDVLASLAEYADKLQNEGRFLVLVVDEFGKMLEHALAHNSAKEIYFIQELAELVNNADGNMLFVSTLHQNFDAYAYELSVKDRKEWEKVKGRLQEIAFNEPVEHLLHLLAQHLRHEGYESRAFDSKLAKLIEASNILGLGSKIDLLEASKIAPFDPLSGMVLALALQRYGQNERSLFTFLASGESYGIRAYLIEREKAPYYNVAWVFDYLIHNYFGYLTSKYNPDFQKWKTLRTALERIETSFGNEDTAPYLALVKTIGLLDLLGLSAGSIDKKLLEKYAELCLGIHEDTAKLLQKLEKDKKIIRYAEFSRRYKPFEGTDVNIDEELEKAMERVTLSDSLADELKSFSQQRYALAKKITFQKGTPRFFKFVLSDEPVTDFRDVTDETDGLINLVFASSKTAENTIKSVTGEPVMYAVFKNHDKLKQQLKAIKATELAMQKRADDRVAVSEFLELKGQQVDELQQEINERLFDKDSEVKWYYNGEKIAIHNKRGFTQKLSDIAAEVYHAAPTFRNELVNKSRLSSNINSAKGKLFSQLLERWQEPEIGFIGEQMPPERMIFASLLKNTGIYQPETESRFAPPSGPIGNTFAQLWAASEAFLESSRDQKRSVAEFGKILSQKPFKLKEGFAEFWIAVFLFLHREDFALFKDDRYEPRFSKEVTELLWRERNSYYIKKFAFDGVKIDLFNRYRTLVQQKQCDFPTTSSIQETVRPFLSFYRQLKPYVQGTERLGADTKAFRTTIQNARELEQTFFEELPAKYGYSLEQLNNDPTAFEGFIDRLQGAIRELRSAYSDLLDRFEGELKNVLGFDALTHAEYREQLAARYTGIREHLLMLRQRALYQRITGTGSEREAWLNALCQNILGKPLESISDADEPLLFSRMKDAFWELDNLRELSGLKFDEDKEEVFHVEVTGFNGGFKENFILSKAQVNALQSNAQRIFNSLGAETSQKEKVATLTKAIQMTLD